MSDDNEQTELEYVRELMSDFDLTPEDTIADLLEALVAEENDGETPSSSD